MTSVAEQDSVPVAFEPSSCLGPKPIAALAAPGTLAPPILGPSTELTHASVWGQLDGSTGSEQSGGTRPFVPVGQLRRF